MPNEFFYFHGVYVCVRRLFRRVLRAGLKVARTVANRTVKWTPAEELVLAKVIRNLDRLSTRLSTRF
jgi:hypothetical protein